MSAESGHLDYGVKCAFSSSLAEMQLSIDGAKHSFSQLVSQLQPESDFLRQVIHQANLSIELLEQQLRMTQSLYQRYGSQCQKNVGSEVDQIKEIAKQLQSLLQARASANFSDEQQFAAAVFSLAPKLNILQQRIAGKMMKVR